MKYDNLKKLNGHHPWMNQVPEGCLVYPVRRIANARVKYFNFGLAKEMGILPKDHPDTMNKALEESIVETFAIRIINEYDYLHSRSWPSNAVQNSRYMATRYLQLQHPNKKGETSGDGRCLWNGMWTSADGRQWDVSSRGVGVTALAPGVIEAGKPLQSGSEEFGYGCGMAENDELIASTIQSEIFAQQGLKTERVLTIVDIGNGLGIGVRAAPNLIRPAHFFSFLKQNRHEPLRRAVDFFLERQLRNGEWNIATAKNKWSQIGERWALDFADFAARLDREYIFAWLDWDGDNVLANAGIIDYGSIRQFGMYHEGYRYDDVDRFSTNLAEQKQKTRQIVQVLSQSLNFIESEKRDSVTKFINSDMVLCFDEQLERKQREYFLQHVGYSTAEARILLNRFQKQVDALLEIHLELERAKVSAKIRKVQDGVIRPALFNMRKLLREWPAKLSQSGWQHREKAESFYAWLLAEETAREDRKKWKNWENKLMRWQTAYLNLLDCLGNNKIEILKGICKRSFGLNHPMRMTGNSLIHIVEAIQKSPYLQDRIDELVKIQVEREESARKDTGIKHLLQLIEAHAEDI